MKKLILAGTAVLAGFAIANRNKLKKEMDELVKQGKLTAIEAQKVLKAFADDAKRQSKELELKVRTEANNLAKKALDGAKKQTNALEKKIKELEGKLKSKEKTTKKAVKKSVKTAKKASKKKAVKKK